MAKYDWYEGKIVDIIDETPTVKRFFIEVPEVKNYKFTAGQFTILEAEINSQVVRREYSIASAPTDGNIFELLIVIAEHGLFTTWLFKEIKVGSTIKTSSALGKFLLPPQLDKEICFICTGVGLAPFRGMIVDIYRRNIPHKDVHLVFGTRYKEDLCYPEELYSLEKKEKTFHFYPTLSREKSEEWNGHKGYVHDIYKGLYEDKRPAYFYICGWKNMIFEARDNLTALGYDRKSIRFELFD
jgi:phenol/toluene 2-monooxygenase (NADH) P5/A5